MFARAWVLTALAFTVAGCAGQTPPSGYHANTTPTITLADPLARALRDFQPEAIWEAMYQEYVRLLRERGLPVPQHGAAVDAEMASVRR